MSKQYVIGIDIGTSGCKTLIIDQNGEVVSRATREYPLSIPQPGWSEQDPEHWWLAVKITLKEALLGFQEKSHIAGIGLSGQMHGLVALDKNGKVLRPAILWNDQRTEVQCRQIHDSVGGIDELLKLTNNRMLPGYTGGKILWVRQNEPELFEQIKVVLNPKDYIRYRLTDIYATEVSDASGTGLFNVYERCWSNKLLEIIDISPDILPNCYESSEISGYLNKTNSSEFGLPDNLPVAGGGGDAVVQTTGTGLVQPGILGTTIGTAGIAAMALDRCYANPQGRLQVFCNNMPDKWHTMGVSLAAGGSLRWARDSIGGSENDTARWLGRDVYELYMEEAAQVQPGCEGLIFLPYLIGERCPYPDSKARGGFIGLTLRHDRRSMFRSILEGAVFSLRDMTQLIIDMGIEVEQIRTSGGGSRSELWRQIHADVFNKEVVIVSGSAEGGAYGAALVAGVGVGIWPDMDSAVAVVEIENSTLPNKDNVDVYNRAYDIYRSLYHTLKGTFDQLAEI